MLWVFSQFALAREASQLHYKRVEQSGEIRQAALHFFDDRGVRTLALAHVSLLSNNDNFIAVDLLSR